MKPLSPGIELDEIVARIIGGAMTRTMAIEDGTAGTVIRSYVLPDEPNAYQPYSQSFAACEPALEWLAKNEPAFNVYHFAEGFHISFMMHPVADRMPQPTVPTFQHSVALAVFAVGAARGVVDEEGNLK